MTRDATTEPAAGADASANALALAQSLIRSPVFWLGCLVFLLGTALYYPLFFPESHRPLTAQSQQFFFQANEAAGAPVLILSLWLFYRRSHLRDVLKGSGSPMLAAVTLVATVALFGWGAYTTSADLQLMSVIGLLAGMVLLFGGLEALRAYWLPILFLGFAVPISPVLIAATIYPVQLATAQYAGLILNTIGAESIVQGDQIIRASNSFIVIETCSGIRTVVTLSMLTILLIDLFERRGLHAAILLGMAPIVAFLANGFRVVTLVLNPHSNIHSVHNLQGIVMLLLGLTAIYLLDVVLERILGRVDPDAAGGDYGTARTVEASSATRLRSLGAMALVLFLMFSLDRWLPRWNLPTRPSPGSVAELLARNFGEDPSAPYPIDYNFIGSVHYRDQARHRVVVDGGVVDIHVGVANEQLRRFSILTKRLAWPGTGFEAVSESFEEIDPDGPVMRRMVLRKGGRRALTYSWIMGRGRFLGEWFRSALALDRSFLMRPHPMLALRLSTDPGRTPEQMAAAEGRIRQVWRQLEDDLARYATTRATHRSSGAGR